MFEVYHSQSAYLLASITQHSQPYRMPAPRERSKSSYLLEGPVNPGQLPSAVARPDTFWGSQSLAFFQGIAAWHSS